MLITETDRATSNRKLVQPGLDEALYKFTVIPRLHLSPFPIKEFNVISCRWRARWFAGEMQNLNANDWKNACQMINRSALAIYNSLH